MQKVNKSRPHARSVIIACLDALEKKGFVRFRKLNVDLPMHGGFHCWVGLNLASHRDYVEVNPFVGVHVVQIMEFYTKVEGRKYDRGIATYAIHLGEIAPSELAFRFNNKTDIEVEAERLSNLYETVGLSFARSISSFETLLPLLLSRVGALGGYPERAAACYYLMGKKSEAKDFVEIFRKLHPDYFDDFASKFNSLL